ncbi:hypothetical protein H4217_006639 [Coemansia sp. RSA 1939]|nr:hypothetical protein H4217_006639 [Coemansia sp. RSA 1939]
MVFNRISGIRSGVVRRLLALSLVRCRFIGAGIKELDGLSCPTLLVSGTAATPGILIAVLSEARRGKVAGEPVEPTEVDGGLLESIRGRALVRVLPAGAPAPACKGGLSRWDVFGLDSTAGIPSAVIDIVAPWPTTGMPLDAVSTTCGIPSILCNSVCGERSCCSACCASTSAGPTPA